jgi:hypothetical protein
MPPLPCFLLAFLVPEDLRDFEAACQTAGSLIPGNLARAEHSFKLYGQEYTSIHRAD